MTEKNKIPWLDFCRALAICLVLFGHSKYLLLPYLPWLEYLKIGGFIGVELFFVLSGFLIGSILIKVNNNSTSYFAWIPAFWSRRWLRTLPNYYFFLIVNIALLFCGIRPEIAGSYLSYFFFLQNLAWVQPSFFGESWSLAVEEIFYLTAPIVIGLISFFTKSKKLGLLLTIGLIFTASLVAKLIYVDLYDPAFDRGVRKIVLLRMDSLMIGVFLAWIAVSIKTPASIKVFRKLGICLFPLLFVHPVFNSLTNIPSDQSYFTRTWQFPITSIGCAGLILVGIYSVNLPKWLAWLSSQIAKISYSIYLVHIPVLYTINYIFGTALLSGYIKWILFISLTFLFASITYRTIEKPFLSYRDRAIPNGGLKMADFGVLARQ